MQKNKLKTFLAFVAAISLGIATLFSNSGLTLLLLLLDLIFAFFFLAILVIGIFSKKFRLWYTVGLVPIIITFTFPGAIRYYKHKKALQLKTQIESFKIKNGKYPLDLKQLNNPVQINELRYVPISDTAYEFIYSIDSFSRELFSSESHEWRILGWND